MEIRQNDRIGYTICIYSSLRQVEWYDTWACKLIKFVLRVSKLEKDWIGFYLHPFWQFHQTYNLTIGTSTHPLHICFFVITAQLSQIFFIYSLFLLFIQVTSAQCNFCFKCAHIPSFHSDNSEAVYKRITMWFSTL